MRKIAAQLLFTGQKFIRNGVLTLNDSGTVLDLSSLGETISEQSGTEFYNGIISPGFVNAHCHLELSHMLGALPEGCGMTAFCKAMISSRKVESREEQIAEMTKRHERMAEEGVVAVGDVSNGETSLAVKTKGNVAYHTFVECFGLDPEAAPAIVDKALRTKAKAEQLGLNASITPHAPYSMSSELFAETVRQGIESGIVSIHNQESLDETNLFKFKSGKMRELFGSNLDEFLYRYDSPLHRILNRIDRKTRLLLVHNVHTARADYERACANNGNIVWVLCPASNLYIENRLPDVNMFVGRNAHVAIGTDSPASNTDMSMMHELKTIAAHFPAIDLSLLLRWATLNGAEALMLDDKFGDFKPGKKPGVVLISGIDFAKMKLTAASTAKRLDQLSIIN